MEGGIRKRNQERRLRSYISQPGDLLYPLVHSLWAGIEEIPEGGESFSPDPLSSLALAATTSGSATLYGKGYTLRHLPRTLVVMRPQPGFREVSEAAPWRTHWVIVAGPLEQAWFRETPFSSYSTLLGQVPVEIRNAFWDACRFVVEAPPGWAWGFLGRLALVLDFARGLKAGHLKGSSPGLEGPVRAFWARNLNHPFSLRELANHLGLSPSTLSHRFRTEAGVPVQLAFKRMRIHRAGELLAAGWGVAEVSESLGFANPYHFSRVFSRITGLSPSQFKKDHQAGPLRNRKKIVLGKKSQPFSIQ